MTEAKLYTPCKIGAIEVANRVAFAPCTRCRSNNVDHKPTDLMAEYYTQRATAGLLIAECTMIAADASAFHSEPGIYEDAQVEGWKKVTDSVHAAGGKIVLQIWHGGRACPAEYNGGKQPVSASDIPIPHRYTSVIQGAPVPYDTPRALSDEEAKEIVKAYGAAAKRAVDAGFDGIEIHGANGYLVNQFLAPSSNKRGPGSYYCGESIETRARFLFDVVDACSAAIGADRVGVRLSPHVTSNEAPWENPVKDIEYVAKGLDERKIAFIHVERRDMFVPGRDLSIDDTPLFRKSFSGTIISNVEYEREEAEKVVEEGTADVIAFGTLLIANPDLLRRFKEKNDKRNANDMATWYGFHVSAPLGAKGYTDYPFLE